MVIAALAVATRLPILLAGHPFWLDEALLAQNLLDPRAGLLDPLYNFQTVGPGFFAPLRAIASIVGLNEAALRIVPFIGGLVAVFAVWKAAAAVGRPVLAPYAAAFAAVSPLLVRYSVELKPYSWDAAFAALAVWLCIRLSDDPTWRRWAWLILAGVVISVSSVPAFLILSGVMAGFLVGGDGPPVRRVRMCVGAALVWGAVFLIAYLRYYAPEEARLISAFGVGGIDAGTFRTLRGFVMTGFVGESAELAFPRRTVGLIGLWIAFGAVALAARRPRRMAVVAGPLVALAIVHLAGRWPLNARVLLWTLPSLCVFAAAGCGEVIAALRRPAWKPAMALPALLLVPALYHAVWTVGRNEPREDVPAAMAELVARAARDPSLAQDRRPTVYVTRHAEPTCRIYAPRAPAEWVCEIPGYRVVTGEWMPLPVRPETTRVWASAEGDLIARELPDGGWLMLAGSAGVRAALVESATSEGLAVDEHRSFSGVDLVRVSPEDSSSRDPDPR